MVRFFALKQLLPDGDARNLAEYFEKLDADAMLARAKFVFPNAEFFVEEEDADKFGGLRSLSMSALAVGGICLHFGGDVLYSAGAILAFFGVCGCFMLPIRFPNEVEDVRNLNVF